jgi:hypothetical protein
VGRGVLEDGEYLLGGVAAHEGTVPVRTVGAEEDGPALDQHLVHLAHLERIDEAAELDLALLLSVLVKEVAGSREAEGGQQFVAVPPHPPHQLAQHN